MIDLQKATELAPGLLNAHYHLGLAHYFQGQFKQWLKTDLLPDKRIRSSGLGEVDATSPHCPRGNDLAAPDEWVKVTERGFAAVEGKSFAKYEQIEVFISRGEVYTAFRAILRIF